MTERGKHLQCDMRKNCLSCSIYTWPPKMKQPKKYYYCEHCNIDIICERGLSISYEYYEDGFVEKKAKCLLCSRILLKKIWPKIPINLKNELLRME
ncbi:MAG: hypothetical protein FK731_09700 [Asgard group archaeon]|nr:hypothetical protein [Asgard group archaeon]